MKTTHFERISTKPVTIQQEVREVVDIPTLDCTTQPHIEVTNYPDIVNGMVLLNGVLLQGAKLMKFETRRVASYHPTPSRVSVEIALPFGRLVLEDVVLSLNNTACPGTAEWKVERPEGVCCVASCSAQCSRLGPDNMYRCRSHYVEKFGNSPLWGKGKW
jgi:hypothetical protein